MKKAIPFLIIFVLSILTGNQANCQRKKNHDRSHWTDTTGSIELQTSRKQFWDSLPDPIGLTTDFENIFTPEEVRKLDSIIIDYEKKTSIELCVVTMDTLNVNSERFGELPEYIGKTWGIGKKEKDNGIVICMSIGYHAIRIGAGHGIDDYLSETDTKQIIEKKFLPDFKKKKYYDGTMNGIIAIIETLDKRMKGRSNALR